MWHIAVDLGAGSGRVFAGRFLDDAVELCELGRFANVPRVVNGRERWDVSTLLGGILAGLRGLGDRSTETVSMGVDTWGVDYGLFDSSGRLIEDPVCYRDRRTEGFVQRVQAELEGDTLFAETGIHDQPFNTLIQICAQRALGEWPDAATRLLLLPDVFHRHLGARPCSEYTMASTTQMLRAGTERWHEQLLRRLDVPLAVLPELVPPATVVGQLREDLQREVGVGPLSIVAPASHDTASAVVGTPLEDGWAFLSSGTWSLLGVEIDRPLCTPEAAALSFSNEGAPEGKTRLLKNIMGLWILEECKRSWARRRIAFEPLADAIERAPAGRALIDPDDPRFFRPEDMVDAVRSFLAETDQPAPEPPGALARIVLESLARRYAEVIDEIGRLTGRSVRGVHIIGGGSQNDFLNRATAEATGLPVRTGPVEATATGNLIAQAVATGRFSSFRDARCFLRRVVPVTDLRWP